MTFPVINHLKFLLPFIKDNPQFRVQEQDNGTTVVCYMLQDEDTFRGQHEEYYKECRGITFNTETGAVVSRTLHKFQNVGENDKTQADQIPWDKITRIMDKRDGSMITPVLLDNGMIACKTKKTFTSNEARAANEFLFNSDPACLAWIHKWLLNGYTPTFEWTSPKFPIVLLYEEDALTLLQMRNNVTGEYVDLTKGPQFGVDDFELMPFPIVPNLIDQYPNPRDLMIEALTAEGIEGWIIQTNEGDMWKIKTKWYCDLHHSVTFTRWRDVARVVLDDKSDDLKAAFAMTGRSIAPIVEVETIVNNAIADLSGKALWIGETARDGGITAAALANAYRDDPLQKHIMRAFIGNPSTMETWRMYYLQKHIRDWSLDVIVEPNEDNDVIPESTES